MDWNRREFIRVGTQALTWAALSGRLRADQVDTEVPAVTAAYRWDPHHPPTGRSVPYLARYQDEYVLKFDKYGEAYVDLGQGEEGELPFTGAFAITVVLQVAKQWPMRAGLVSKWDYMPGEASYECGLMPDERVYFRVSADGDADGEVTEIVSDRDIVRERPTVVTAVFEPGQRMELFIDGKSVAKQNEGIPAKLEQNDVPVRVGQRFEGLIAGVWFHGKALSAEEAKQGYAVLAELMPTGVTYKQWERQKRNIKSAKVDYLGTTAGVELLKEIDIRPWAGSYVCVGDLTNDGRVDYLLYKNGSAYTVPGRLIALDHDGRKLWEVGDTSLERHINVGKAQVGQEGTTPALRGICTIYDIDGDGKAEVISELWEEDRPRLVILEGATGRVKKKIDSPLDMSIRQPARLGSRQPSRGHPVIRIAHLAGKDGPASIILKYGASNGIDCHAFALNADLEQLWHIPAGVHAMGHVPTVADVDGDGRDEIVLGHMLADHHGKVIWDHGREFTWHADTTAVEELMPGRGKQVLISVCGVGPVYCLSAEGHMLWGKSREEVEHGQGVWVGNFIDDEPGKEVIVCTRGHIGAFTTFRGTDGKMLARFEQRKLLPAYPDFPTVVNWQSTEVQSLWLPQDRTLVDGWGEIVAEMGGYDEYVQKKLRPGTSWRPVGAQVFSVDLCGDERDELIMYEPYNGESIFIFAHPGEKPAHKPYVAQEAAYNIRSYF